MPSRRGPGPTDEPDGAPVDGAADAAPTTAGEPPSPEDGRPPDPAEVAARRAQLDREWRAAMVIAVVLLVLGQVLLLVGWWPVALVAVAVPGTAAAAVLLRRWRRLGA